MLALVIFWISCNPANFCLFKSTIETLEKMWNKKLTIKTPEQRQWGRCGVFILNFEYISRLFPSVSIVDFEQVYVSWEVSGSDCRRKLYSKCSCKNKLSIACYNSKA